MEIHHILFYSLLAVIGFLLGKFVATQNKCKHNWELMESGELVKKDGFNTIVVRGFIKVYECKECKKMRKEQITIDN